MAMNLSGILPPMITPFKQNGDMDYEAFVFNMEKWNQTGLSGYVVLGSNSETAFLNEEEKLKLVELAVKHSGGRTIMAGTGMETPRDTIELTNKAAALGADCALLLTPCYYNTAMTSAALYEYFAEVADKCKIPILLYNVTKFTKVNISPDLFGKLAKHPNIVGAKDSNGDVPQFASYMRAIAGEDFKIFVGTAAALYPALTLGAVGGILALANCCPVESVEVYDEFKEGNLNTALEIYQRMFPINTAVTATYGIAGLKHACSLLGFQGGYVRRPLLELNEKDKEAIKAILEKAGIRGVARA